MRIDQLEKELEYQKQAATQAQAQGGLCGNAAKTIAFADDPCRLSLRERITGQLHRARCEAAKRERLEELSYLLDKNPEIARILDLVEETR